MYFWNKNAAVGKPLKAEIDFSYLIGWVTKNNLNKNEFINNFC